MTHNSMNITETEDIEFTAAYGTAVAISAKRHPAIGRHDQEAAGETSGDVATRANITPPTTSIAPG